MAFMPVVILLSSSPPLGQTHTDVTLDLPLLETDTSG